MAGDGGMGGPIRNPAGYRAALYIRLSKEDENPGASESIQNQRFLLEEFARQQGLPVYDVYADDGYSGTTFERPAFRRLLADIEAGRVNMVITKDLSRLGRDYILTGHYLERYFPEHQVRYLSLLDGIDTGTDSTANDMTPFRALLNDMYAKDISKKIASVKRDKQRRGLFIGGKPAYGYRMHPSEKNRIVIDPDAAPVVQRIFGMALEGMSCRRIAAQLNAEGLPTPSAYAGRPVGSGLWSGERISDMLQNAVYIGSMVQGRSRRASYKSKKCIRQPREDWVVVENTHAPIISGEDFAQVQRMLGSRRHTRSRAYDFLLKGLAFCHECGHPLAVINRRNAKGEDCLYFVCRTYQRFGQAGGCSCHSVREQAVTQAVTGKVRDICGRALLAGQLLPIALQEVARAQEGAGAGRQLAELQSRIGRLGAQMDRAYLDRLQGLLEEEDFARLYARLKGEREILKRQLGEFASAACPAPGQAALAKRLTEQFLETIPQNRELMVRLIERVELTADKALIIRFRFRQPREGE